jgi:DNA cross-link repair 1A protein
VPYSEHSSFFELTCFALSLDWARIVATVNVESGASRAKISAWVALWEAERRKRPHGSVVPYRTLEYW